MLYCDCDNDLEAAGLQSLRELCKVGSSPSVALVALVDRAQKRRGDGYTDEPLLNLPDWATAKLIKLGQGEVEELDDWGEVNMASGAVLGRFLKEARGRFPAEHYALVMLDHGDAWAGVCVDDSAPEPDDLLRPAELSEALAGAGFTGPSQLDLLVFDACLMANLELLSALQDRARWVVASEEIVPDSGLLYAGSLTQLRRDSWKGSDEALRLAEDLVQRNRPELNPDLTHLALLRLDRLPELERLLEQLAQKLVAKLKAKPKATWLKLARCRSQSQEFGRSDVPLVPNAEVRDVVDLCHYVALSFPDLRGLCQQIHKSALSIRVHQVRGKSLPHAEGLTIFFPALKESTQELASTDYFSLVPSQLSQWALLVKTYTQMERDDTSRPALEKIQASAEEWEPGETVELRSRLSRPEELESCHFIITQNDLIMGCTPSWPEEDSTLVTDEFDGTSLALGDQAGWPFLWCPLAHLAGSVSPPRADEESGSEEVLLSPVRAQLKRPGSSEWVDVSLIFRYDLKDSLRGQLVRVVASPRLHPSRLTLKKGDTLRLLHESLRAGAGLQPGPPLTLSNPERLSVRPRRLSPGSYLMGFRIRDYSGRQALQTAPIRVLP